MEKSQTFKETLKNLGYKLIDSGDSWRTNAKYRDGKNPMSIMIYKNTGVWRDFGSDDGLSYPFARLVELTNGEKRFTGINPTGAFIDEIFDEEELMDKVFPKSYLDKLFPNYHFYKQRNISEPEK